uniref:Uncharacterized protein n=1 Tax=Oryza glaberrima TaxID=4538 RepID=I1QCR7_ORYGL
MAWLPRSTNARRPATCQAARRDGAGWATISGGQPKQPTRRPARRDGTRRGRQARIFGGDEQPTYVARASRRIPSRPFLKQVPIRSPFCLISSSVPPLLLAREFLGWIETAGCHLSAGEAQDAEAMPPSPRFSFGQIWRGGRRVVAWRGPRPALRDGGSMKSADGGASVRCGGSLVVGSTGS